MAKGNSLAIALSVQSKNKKKKPMSGLTKGEDDKKEVSDNKGDKELKDSKWTDNKSDSTKDEKPESGSTSKIDESPSHSEGETREEMLERHASEMATFEGRDDEKAAKMADGGMVGPDKSKAHSVADMIRAKRMADGGMVDLEANSKEDYNHEDDDSFKAKGAEQYDDSQLSKQPNDSNLHNKAMGTDDSSSMSGDADEQAMDNHLDMISQIRNKIKSKRGM